MVVRGLYKALASIIRNGAKVGFGEMLLLVCGILVVERETYIIPTLHEKPPHFSRIPLTPFQRLGFLSSELCVLMIEQAGYDAVDLDISGRGAVIRVFWVRGTNVGDFKHYIGIGGLCCCHKRGHAWSILMTFL